MNPASSTASQWLFPVSALQNTPSIATSNFSLQKELYDRARGVEFLFRLGSSLQLPSSAMFTAATWFHRFYMRYSLEDYHRQDVAAACIFLATKTEECGRKLRDVARVCLAKSSGEDMSRIPPESKEVDQTLNAILRTEEALLEALCFDFIVENPHDELVALFDAQDVSRQVQEHAWTIAHDSYRTPLCVLYPPRIAAAASYILAQRIVDGPLSPSLDARIAYPAPSTTLPTPPTHKPASPDASRFAIEYFAFDEMRLAELADALCIILEFYNAQDIQGHLPWVSVLADIAPPTARSSRTALYAPFAHVQATAGARPPAVANATQGGTPSPSPGGDTPGPPHVLKSDDRK